ncbi:MAG: restriction endonuclease subunit S, partial [Magnetococcales bacterium]|nr:restriction endonuclease subunit S [Magnetococcales bacterium]
MTPARFLANFGHLAGTPGVVKRLRELILQLAVQGKLVHQDPNDEPASVLLKKIAKEKARLVREGKMRPPKPLPPIKPEEVPF